MPAPPGISARRVTAAAAHTGQTLTLHLAFKQRARCAQSLYNFCGTPPFNQFDFKENKYGLLLQTMYCGKIPTLLAPCEALLRQRKVRTRNLSGRLAIKAEVGLTKSQSSQLSSQQCPPPSQSPRVSFSSASPGKYHQ